MYYDNTPKEGGIKGSFQFSRKLINNKKQTMTKKTTVQKSTLVMEHIRMFTHFKLSVLEAQCGIPSNYLCKQLKGTDIMKDKHFDALYDYLKKTSFKGK